LFNGNSRIRDTQATADQQNERRPDRERRQKEEAKSAEKVSTGTAAKAG
jgi:hypothetical protein